MPDPAIENVTKAIADGLPNGNTTSKIGEAGAALLSETRDNAKIAMDKNAAAFNETGHSVLAAFQDLTQAYQQIASKNSARLTQSIQELGAIKNPADFVGLQQKLVKEGIENALADSKHITEITLSIFTTAFEPMKKNFASLQQAMPQSARPAR